MVIKKQVGPQGSYWLRPKFVAADYQPTANDLSLIESFRGANEDTITLYEDREGPFTNFELMRDGLRDGKRFLTLLHRTQSFAIAIEVVSEGGFGELRVLPPEEAYQLSVEHDGRRTDLKVVQA